MTGNSCFNLNTQCTSSTGLIREEWTALRWSKHFALYSQTTYHSSSPIFDLLSLDFLMKLLSHSPSRMVRSHNTYEDLDLTNNAGAKTSPLYQMMLNAVSYTNALAIFGPELGTSGMPNPLKTRTNENGSKEQDFFEVCSRLHREHTADRGSRTLATKPCCTVSGKILAQNDLG